MSYDILRHIVYVSLNTSYFRELPCQFCHTLVYKCYLGICWGWWDFSERIQSVVYSIEQFQCQDAKTSEWLRSQYALKWTLFPLGLSPYFNFSEELCLQTYIGVTANDFKTRYRNHSKSLATQREVEARNGVIQPRLEPKKGKSAIFDQMGHRQANRSRQKRKTKLHSVHSQ